MERVAFHSPETGFAVLRVKVRDHRDLVTVIGAAADKALAFVVSWPALEEAAQLVLDRATELDGDHYEILAPAANALEEKHALAATVLRRAMIDFTLTASRAKRYRHAARHLAECASLAARIEDFGALEPHDAYVAGLRVTHGRKTAFWSLVS